MSIETNKSFQIIFVIFISGIVIFHRLGEAPLGGDDCFYSEKAKEMALTGDYLTLKYGYKVNINSKPPFIFWMMSFFGRIFGFNNFGMRIGSAIIGYCGIVTTLFFVSKFFNSYVGFISAIVLTFTQQYYYHARSAVTDCPLAVFIALSLYCFWIAYNKDISIFYYFMGIFIGLAVMTKQVNGLLAYLIIGGYVMLSKNYKILLNIHFYFGVFLSILIFLPWHLWSIITYGREFINSYFGIIVQFGITGKGVHVEPWYEHIKKIIENYWPWLPFFVYGLYKMTKNLIKKDLSYEELDKRRFLLSWSVLPFVLFQLAKVKHTQFLVPLYIPFSIIVGLTFDEFKTVVKHKITLILCVILSLVTIFFVSFPWIPQTLDSCEYREYISLIPEIKKINKNLYTLHKNFWYFSNANWFYGNKRTIGLTKEELEEKLNSSIVSYFVLFSDDFFYFKRKYPNKVRILKATKKVVFFSNSLKLNKT